MYISRAEHISDSVASLQNDICRQYITHTCLHAQAHGWSFYKPARLHHKAAHAACTFRMTSLGYEGGLQGGTSPAGVRFHLRSLKPPRLTEMGIPPTFFSHHTVYNWFTDQNSLPPSSLTFIINVTTSLEWNSLPSFLIKCFFILHSMNHMMCWINIFMYLPELCMPMDGLLISQSSHVSTSQIVICSPPSYFYYPPMYPSSSGSSHYAWYYKLEAEGASPPGSAMGSSANFIIMKTFKDTLSKDQTHSFGFYQWKKQWGKCFHLRL